MPAKKQITEEAILNAATEIFREHGMEAINARELARRLGCSTQPIYLSFTGMDKIKSALVRRMKSLYESYLAHEIARGEYPPYKASGMGYIRFAKEEREMFRFLFMRARTDFEQKNETSDSYQSIIELIAKQNGLSYEIAEQFHMEMWVFVHGIATMLATSFLDLKWEVISEMLTDSYQSLKNHYAQKKGATDGRN